MRDEAPFTLTPRERDEVSAAWVACRASAPRLDPQVPGCGLAFLGMVVLTLTPAVGRWIPPSRGLGDALFVLAVGALLAGGLWALLGGAAERRRAAREVAAARSILAEVAPGGARTAALRAAVRLVFWSGAGRTGGTGVGPGAERALAGLAPEAVDLVRAVAAYRLSSERTPPQLT
ncbi:MAG: hypothetical protein RQ751_04755 [Longimicrobiales bacterium]|nr:hypothetical protein [Longimicrobiales bacterium]